MILKCDRWPVSYLGGMHNYPIMRSMSKENSHIQHTLVLKVGVEQQDQTSLTWRMHMLFFDRLHGHEHMVSSCNLLEINKKSQYGPIRPTRLELIPVSVA